MQDAMLQVRDAGIKPEAEYGSSAQKLLAQGSCPKIEIVDDLQMVHDFVPGLTRLPNTLISRADIETAISTCDYTQNSVSAKTIINFTAISGAAHTAPNMPINETYFIAVTTKSGRILAKEVFPVSVQWNPAQNRYTAQDTVKQIIPIPRHQNGNDYKIMIGFQINDDKLTFNRALLKAQKEAAKTVVTVPEPIQRSSDNIISAPVDLRTVQ